MDEDNRHEIVAETLQPVLEEGEAFNVYCHEGEVFVTDLQTSSCAVLYPRLYGRLLSLNTRIEEAGAGIGSLPLLLILSLCVGLHLHWWDTFLGPDLVERLDSIWFYLLVFVVTFQLLGMLRKPLKHAAFSNGRDELIALILREELDRDRLLATIEADPAVAQVGYYLKLDTAPPSLNG